MLEFTQRLDVREHSNPKTGILYLLRHTLEDGVIQRNSGQMDRNRFGKP